MNSTQKTRFLRSVAPVTNALASLGSLATMYGYCYSRKAGEYPLEAPINPPVHCSHPPLKRTPKGSPLQKSERDEEGVPRTFILIEGTPAVPWTWLMIQTAMSGLPRWRVPRILHYNTDYMYRKRSDKETLCFSQGALRVSKPMGPQLMWWIRQSTTFLLTGVTRLLYIGSSFPSHLPGSDMDSSNFDEF